MAALAVLAFIAVIIALVVAAAPQARTACPPGQHVTVTGHATVRIGHTSAAVPVYGCRP